MVLDAASEQKVSKMRNETTSSFALRVEPQSSGESGSLGCIYCWYQYHRTKLEQVQGDHRRGSAGAGSSRGVAEAEFEQVRKNYRLGSAGSGSSRGAAGS